MPRHRGHAGHQDGPQPRRRRVDHGLELTQALLLEMIGEFHDEDAVLGNQAHQRDQPDLGINVQGGHAEEGEDHGSRQRQRHRAEQDDERIAEALELRRQHQEDQQQRQHEQAAELVTLHAQLPRGTAVVDGVALGHNLGGFVFHRLELGVKRHVGAGD